MDKLADLGINLLATLIGFIAGWVWQKSRQAIRLRHARRFWKPFVSGDLHVVIGRFEKFAEFEPSGFLGVGDAIGLSELRVFFETLGMSDFPVEYADQICGDSLKSNLVVIGGPDANSVTNEIVNKISTTLHFGNPEVHEVALYDSLQNKLYLPLVESNTGQAHKDFGLIIKTINPFAKDKYVLLMAGSFGYGSWAAAKFSTTKEFTTNPLVLMNDKIECLIETDIVHNTPQDIRIVALRELSQ